MKKYSINASSRKNRTLLSLAALSVCIYLALDLGNLLAKLQSDGRRTLGAGEDPVYDWARWNLRPVTTRPDPEKETILFWHIPKSGGTTAKAIYECLGQTLANRLGGDPKFGHHKDEEIVAFEPWRNGMKYVNVDTTSKDGILRAAKMGLVPSGEVDMIFTSDPNFAIDHLFDPLHKGRVFVLLRHPIERLVSKFYYLQTATWERTYSPEWKKLSLYKWAKSHNRDEDHMVKKLAGKLLREEATEMDLRVAKRVMRLRFIVGLMDQMEESIHRFNKVMAIDETEDKNKFCMEKFFGDNAVKKNSHKHPNVKEGGAAWNLLAERNSYDMKLYEYALELFAEQRAIIDSYTNIQ